MFYVENSHSMESAYLKFTPNYITKSKLYLYICKCAGKLYSIKFSLDRENINNTRV